ncbi:flagellar basal body rod protein FlgF [Xylophilus ampelinus]|uniref:Flagellar basal-body rod protein FlgF n=1 Tax=Xylophilus ampelinus TaxID=54067 RepID=A0A318SDE0_9BURK|nr:flagellar basal body rod protein FlgF [Xylophilus ampelinus]MCS4511229.1 flagellar basal body rod protein FlgF [Xylophilus ampelinus]PYE75018.1 flagellar basal-body rod protein FlgF [Xylophilus ampelinus]
MDRLIYTSMTGASAAAARQTVLANNLANASTNGFRAELSQFRAVPLNGSGASTRVFSVETTAGFDDRRGAMQPTGRNMDAMAQGNAWFAVQGLDGTEAYTKNGTLEVNAQGTLVNSVGLTVLSDGGAPIDVPPGAQIALGQDGTITAKTDGQPPATLGRLKLATPTPEDPMKRSDDGLFRARSGEPVPQDALARIQTGAVESSNVNPVEAMVGMIAAARQFEQQMRLMQNAETNDKTASKLLSMQG